MYTSSSCDNHVLAVYISGYHITTLVVNLSAHEVLSSSYQRKAINSRGTANEIINECSNVIKQTLNIYPALKYIGIAMPGPFNYEKGISYIRNNKKHEALYGLNIKELLSERLNIPVAGICMVNDAASFLKGEVFAGVARGYQNVIGLTLGTGLGTAKIINGIAEDAGLWEAPFLDSIAEDYLSERWFLKRYYELSGINVVDVRELSSFYNTSNTVKNVFKEFAGNLAIFIINFVKSVYPEIIVLSGDIVAKAADCFMPALKSQVNKAGIDIPLCISNLNSDAVLIGVASSWHV